MGAGYARSDRAEDSSDVREAGCEDCGVGDALKEADEANADTARIQGAVDNFAAKCKPGQAVELAAGVKGANAFLSGPLELKEGVTLLVDKGVTLFASRDPKDYDMPVQRMPGGRASGGPGTCGTIPAKGQCKAFLTIRAKNDGIMGDGVIDGRGGAKLLGQDYLVVGAGGERRADGCAA